MQVKVEMLYNALPIKSVLFMDNLFFGLLSLGITIYKRRIGKSSFYGQSYHCCFNVARTQLSLFCRSFNNTDTTWCHFRSYNNGKRISILS